jgi:hypothetical protein
MKDPVSTADGHSFERPAIVTWLLSNGASPVTGAELPDRSTIPARALRDSVEEWQANHMLFMPRGNIVFDISSTLIGAGSSKAVFKGSPCATASAEAHICREESRKRHFVNALTRRPQEPRSNTAATCE